MYRIFLVQDKNTKEFVRKYQYKYSITNELEWSKFFTIVLGQARIFDTKARAKAFMDGCTRLTKYLHADLEIVSYRCNQEA